MKTIQELEAMSDDELRVMLAELDGWEFCEKARTKHRKPLPWTIPHCRHPKHTRGIWRIRARLTDYPRDLDACHAVLHTITPAQHSAYQVHLADFSGTFRNAIDAPPRERTIALIATLQPQ